MAKPKKKYSQLTPAYKQRLKRAGVSPNTYNAGKADLRKARGHGSTPERPERAFAKPHLYPEYTRRRLASGKYVPPNLIPEQSFQGGTRGRGKPTPFTVAQIGDQIGYPNRAGIQVHYIWRTKRGVELRNTNADVVDARTWQDESELETVYPYNEADWRELYDMVKERGFIAFIQSGQYSFVTT